MINNTFVNKENEERREQNIETNAFNKILLLPPSRGRGAAPQDMLRCDAGPGKRMEVELRL